MADTTVYSIYAGYIPQLGVGPEEFKQLAPARGQARKYEFGTRYDGEKRTLGNISTGIHTDGKLGAARVRGSIAWYEHTDKKRKVDVTNALQDPHGGTELSQEIKDLSRQWYGGGSVPGWNARQKTRDRALLQKFEDLMDLPKYKPSGAPITGGEDAQPEEQFIRRGGTGGPSMWKPSDKGLRDESRIIQANAIDVYFRDVEGNIHRLDVTAQTMDDESAHHGLTSHEDRKAKGVTGQDLIQMIDDDKGNVDRAQEKLLGYFNDTQETHWNPPIRSMKDIISKQKISGAADLLDQLKKGETDLANLRLETNKKLQGLLEAMRGKGVTGHKTYLDKSGDAEEYKRFGGGYGKKGGHGKTGKGMGWQAAANAIRMEYIESAGQIGGYGAEAATLGLGKVGKTHPNRGGPLGSKTEAMNAGLEFALHMMGNVMELFRSDSARQGGYSTAYTMGEGDTTTKGGYNAANFTIEVRHTIASSGEDVFEFIKMQQGDVIIWSEAALTAAYQKEYWYKGEKGQHAHVLAHAIRQNQLATLQVMGINETGVRIGDVVAVAHEMTKAEASKAEPKILWTGTRSKSGVQGRTHAGSAKILPQKVNASIDRWIKEVTANFAGKQSTDSAVRDLIRNETREFASAGQLVKKRGSQSPQFQSSAYAKKRPQGRYHPDQVRANNRKLTGAWAIPKNIKQAAQSATGGGGNPGVIKGKKTFWSQFPLSVGMEAAWGGIHGVTTRSAQREQEVADVLGIGLNDAGDPDTTSQNWGSMQGSNPWERAGNITFWGTPYLSLLYPSTQVRNTD